MSDREVKILSGKPGRPKGVTILSDRGNPTAEVEVLQSGTKIIDQNAPKPEPEITSNEGDRDAT